MSYVRLLLSKIYKYVLILIRWWLRMPKKKRFGVTSTTRYKIKVFRVFSAGVPEELAMEHTSSQADAWNTGFGEYKKLHDKIMESDTFKNIPAGLRGLYLAYCNEVNARVMTRKIERLETVIEKWVRLGLDRGILEDLAEEMGARPVTETPKPASKS
jgi:hypothetical protein